MRDELACAPNRALVLPVAERSPRPLAVVSRNILHKACHLNSFLPKDLLRNLEGNLLLKDSITVVGADCALVQNTLGSTAFRPSQAEKHPCLT